MTDEHRHLLAPHLLARAVTLVLSLCTTSSCTQIWSPFIAYDVVDAALPDLNIADAALPTPLPPTLSAVAPALGPSAGGVTLTLSGQNFVAGAMVSIAGGTALTAGSGTTLTALLPARPGAFGKVPVTVQNPDGQSASRSDLFSYYASQVVFSPGPNSPIPVGTNPRGIGVGDFNGDNKLDLAVANEKGGDVSMLLGNGAGRFSPGISIPVGVSLFAVAVGDVNGDQKLDLAITDRAANGVFILLGDGSGGFIAKNSFPTGVLPNAVAFGDFNADKRIDVVVANQGNNNVSVLLGDGAGSFGLAPGSPYAVGAIPVSVVVGDFNGDQKSDLATANYNGGDVSVLIGDGSGRFSPMVGSPFSAGPQPLSMVVSDVNSDQKPDFAVANATGSVSVLLGNGKGIFSMTGQVGVGNTPAFLAVSDFNGDQNPDLVTANFNGANASLLIGDGKGGFSPAPQSPINVGGMPFSVAVGDFNGDQRPDFAVGNFGSNYVSILLNQSQ